MQQSVQPHEEMVKNSVLGQLRTSSQDIFSKGRWLERKNRKTPAKSYTRKYMFKFSMGGNIRVLRRRSVEKPEVFETSNNVVKKVGSEGEKTRRKRKRTELLQDEFTKARKHLKYILQRISYEQNLIDVYSVEGWKRQSVDKIRPEMELQRAKAKILHCKLRIRDLFKHVDSLCVQGRLPDSLFDAEGQIDSEDIFCAKCGTDDVSANNDIVLCDGVCERGFHQVCLDPPLLNVPDNDEGWLCPGCDCKVDCIDILNESQGTKLSIEDSWEKVFPEAVCEPAPGNCTNHCSGFPSDDSEDNDFGPDASKNDDEIVKSRRSSRKIVRPSVPIDLHVLDLLSDESEDDDYMPNESQIDVQNNNPENSSSSSSSGFTSDSEDVTATLDDANKVEDALMECSKLCSGSTRRRSKFVGNKNLMNDEQKPDDSSKNDQFWGLPSEDSEDDDYDPNSPQIDEQNNSESLSLGSTSESEDQTATFEDANKAADSSFYISGRSARQGSKIAGNKSLRSDEQKQDDSSKNDQFLGFPSEDSEDDDYDPNSEQIDEQNNSESSSSISTSDSEDQTATFVDPNRVEDSSFKLSGRSARQRSKIVGNNNFLNDEQRQNDLSKNDQFWLPSEDSEDDDYDPNSPQIDEQSSSSISTSECEDQTATFEDANKVEDSSFNISGRSARQASKIAGNKSLPNDEQKQDNSSKNGQFLGFPSEDSEDNDYDPNSVQIDEQNNSESSSLVSSSDSEDRTATFVDSNRVEGSSFKLSGRSARQRSKIVSNNNFLNGEQRQDDLSKYDQFWGLPSEDSEDDDYDPNSAQIDEQNNSESSHFISTSECGYQTATFEDANKVEDSSFKLSGRSDRQGLKIVGNNNFLNDGQEDVMLKLNPGEDDSEPISEVKLAEGLQNKKIDAVYENISDSSDDDVELIEVTPRRKVVKNRADFSASPKNGKSPIMSNGFSTDDVKHNIKDSKSLKNSREHSVTPGTPFLKHVTEELHKVFKENQYPDTKRKEILAKELGLQLKQVNKWFGNARWSFQHRSSMEATTETEKNKTPEAMTEQSRKASSSKRRK